MKKLFLLSGISALLIACGGGGGGGGGSSSPGDTGGSGDTDTFDESDIAALVEEIVDNSIVPSALSFTAAAEALASQAEDFCVTPTASSLELVQDAWLNTQESWYHLASYNFGPLNADIVFPEFTFIDSLRLRGTNYLETVRGDVSELIAADSVLDSAFFASQTFQNTGLLAIEVLAFETNDDMHSTLVSDIVDEFVATPRKCELLIGQAEQLALRASDVSEAWQDGFRDSFLEVGLDDGSDPIVILIQAMQNYMDYLHNRGVVSVTAQVSQENWASVAAAAEEVEDFLEGISQNGGFFCRDDFKRQ